MIPLVPSPRLRFRLAGAAVLLAMFTGLCAEPLVLAPLKPSGIYERGEKAGWIATLPDGVPAPAGGYRYVVKRNDAEPIATGTIAADAGPTEIAVTLDEPAMLFVEVTSDGGDADRTVAGAAIAPTELRPVLDRPADFDAFWAAAIQQLEAIPAEPVLTVTESGREGVEYATLRMNSVEGSHIYGQLAKPAREGKFPAMLQLQWAGGPYPLQKAWVADRAADGWLALNVSAHDVPIDLPQAFYDALPAMIKSYHTLYHDDRDRNYFRRMYLGAYRAVQYLVNRPDWDGRVLLVTGTSMGGQQSLAVAGLHPRITHLIVHVPAGADANAALHGRSAGYPNWDHTNPRVMETARYFDTVNFAPQIKARSLVSMGFVDRVCPPAGIWTAFNLIPGEKEVVPLVDAAHNHQATAEQQRAYTERAAAWMAALVQEREP